MWTCTNQSETSESWRSDNRVGSGRRDAGTQGRRDGGTGGRGDAGMTDVLMGWKSRPRREAACGEGVMSRCGLREGKAHVGQMGARNKEARGEPTWL